jgi:hypothetical protein
MAPGRLGAQNLAASGNFEPFRNGFPSFTAGDGLGHEARKIDAAAAMTNPFSRTVRTAKLQIPSSKVQRNSKAQSLKNPPAI